MISAWLKMLAIFAGCLLLGLVGAAGVALIGCEVLGGPPECAAGVLQKYGDLFGGIFTFGAAVVAWEATRAEGRHAERTGALAALTLGADMTRQVGRVRHYSTVEGIRSPVALTWRTDGRLETALRARREVCDAVLLADEAFAKWNYYCEGNLWYSPDKYLASTKNEEAHREAVRATGLELIEFMIGSTKRLVEISESETRTIRWYWSRLWRYD